MWVHNAHQVIIIVQAVIIQGYGTEAMWLHPPHPLDLFRFVDGSADNWRHGVEMGTAPWYTEPSVRLAFARPISSLTHWLDYTFIADWPALTDDVLEGPGDPPVRTNYRDALAPILSKFGVADKLADIFPNHRFSDLDLFS